jgi:hypothetical protein
LVWCVDVQVLQVAAGELLVRDDLDLALALLGDLDDVAEVTGAALDLDAVVDGLRAVDDELSQTLAPIPMQAQLREWNIHTFLVTLVPFLAAAPDFFYMFT